MPTTLTVFRCPKDKIRFEHEGSSYEWFALLNGKALGRRGEGAALLWDYDKVHYGVNGGAQYFWFADGHVARY